MRIFREITYKKHIARIKANSFMKGYEDGYNAALEEFGKDSYDRDLREGRITINEYRRLKYFLPPIKQNKGE